MENQCILRRHLPKSSRVPFKVVEPVGGRRVGAKAVHILIEIHGPLLDVVALVRQTLQAVIKGLLIEAATRGRALRAEGSCGAQEEGKEAIHRTLDE